MKFGKQLEEYELSEWRGHYIPYKALKKRLEEIAGQPHSPATPDVQAPATQPGGGPAEAAGDPAGVWRAWLEREAFRVGEFVDRGLAGLEAQLQDLSRMGDSLHGSRLDEEAPSHDEAAASDGEAAFLELRLLEAVGRVAEGVQRLSGFAELNHAALYKILKKHDKHLVCRRGLGTRDQAGIFSQLVKATRLGESERFDALEAELRRLSLSSGQTRGLDASVEVARLAAGLGRRGQAAGLATVQRNELVLSFFLGSSSALFVLIGVLLILPAQSPRSFSEAYFLTPMPVFRVVFSVLLSLWCMGAVARTCDRWDINHMFILSVDPRCRVNPEFFFSRAAALTTIWILVFSLYVVDYKWRMLPTIWASRGLNDRSSFHFVVYPVLLVVLTVLGMLWPSKICRNRYKASVLRSVRRTALAPLYPVDFADNIVGDVLTSLAKPLQDVPAAVCYLASPHPQAANFVERFVEKGDTCSDTTRHFVLPLIAGLPFVFRALQCLRRFRDTKEPRHLWNFGKYAASLLVVVVSSSFASPLLVAAVSAVATVYAAIWDVALDWGLGAADLLRGDALDTGPSERKVSEAGLVDATGSQSSRVIPARAECPARHFPRRVYWLCSAVDLLLRSTWALTLMPITIVADSITGRVVLVSLISSVEIIRRSMWAILRIEYEQVANASGFRALLWVPSKLNAPEHQPALRGQKGLAKPLLA